MKVNAFFNLAMIAPAAIGCCNTKCISPKAAARTPNIVFFLVDDMGWVDSGVQYGDSLYPHNLRFNTPNMQRLARKSVVMQNAYACPVSTPTRTSIMTGMNAAHMRITNWTSALRDDPSDASGGGNSISGVRASEDRFDGDVLRRGDWNYNGLSPEPGIDHAQYATPMVRLLKDAGYFTIHAGKAHWACMGTPGASPYNMGFVVNVAGSINGQPRTYLSEEHYGNIQGKWNYMSVQNMAEYYETGTHLTEALTLEALKTLEYPIDHKVPFYLYLAHYATHTPIQRDGRFVQKYLDAGMDEGQARYASMVEGVDKSLGDLLDYLEEKGVADNTVIIFMTDNGGNSENKQKGGVPHTQNAPLREGKGSCYEGGVRVPLMFFWPGRTRPGKCNTPVTCEDLFPTILEIAGIHNPKVSQEVDGESLVGIFADSKSPVPSYERPIVEHYPHKWKAYDLDDIDYLSSVRCGDWKLVYRMKTAELELYNLKDDISERNNLSARYPEKTKEMARVLGDKLRGWNASMPIVSATGKPVPMPDEL